MISRASSWSHYHKVTMITHNQPISTIIYHHYPLVMWHSYRKWPSRNSGVSHQVVDLSIAMQQITATIHHHLPWATSIFLWFSHGFPDFLVPSLGPRVSWVPRPDPHVGGSWWRPHPAFSASRHWALLQGPRPWWSRWERWMGFWWILMDFYHGLYDGIIMIKYMWIFKYHGIIGSIFFQWY